MEIKTEIKDIKITAHITWSGDVKKAREKFNKMLAEKGVER